MGKTELMLRKAINHAMTSPKGSKTLVVAPTHSYACDLVDRAVLMARKDGIPLRQYRQIGTQRER